MKSKIFRNISWQPFTLFVKQVGGVSLITLATSLFFLNACSKKSQKEEDIANLKLVGYDMDLTGLCNAVENDDVTVLKVFKSHKFDLHQSDLKGRTAMHVAAECGSMAALNYLVKHGAVIDIADINGLTPLMVGARAGLTAGSDGNAEIIKFLLEKGADAKKKDLQNKFALIHALDGGSPQAIELLAAESRELLDTGLLYSADLNKYASIPVLVRYGASVYSRNSGKTGLMIAAERGHFEAVQALVDEGANLYAVSDDGMLAMDFAEGDEEVIAVLLGAEKEVGEDALALDWSEEELEALIQKAMDRAPVVDDTISSKVSSSATVSKLEGPSGTSGGGVSIKPSSTGGETGGEPQLGSDLASSENTPKGDIVVQRIRGKNLPLELADTKVAARQVTMTAYAEKSLPVKVTAIDEGRVEVYDLRLSERAKNLDPVVSEGSQIGVTGLRVKKIRKEIVNNKLTGGQDKELVTLMVEDQERGKFRELYAGYESQAAEAIAVLKMNETGEHWIVERNDEFYGMKGTSYKVVDVNDTEVIIENTVTSQVSILPLMGVKR